MKFLSTDWFKSKIEQATEVVAKKIVTKKIETIMEESDDSYESEGYPYKNLIYINGNLTVIFHDGDTLFRDNVTEEEYEDIFNADTREEIEFLMTSEETKKDIEKKEAILSDISLLLESGLFEYRDNCVYMTGIKRTIPILLVNKFAELLQDIQDENFDDDWTLFIDTNEEFISYKKFWQKCCLNPSAKSAEDLYEFLSHHQFKIDRHGNFYTYRRVVSKGAIDKELVEFISNSYNKVKAIWKKKALSYNVYSTTEGYNISSSDVVNSEWQYIGNLEQLYLDLPNMKGNSYTSAHTGREDYKIGEIISMPRQNGDDNNRVSCSKGFHQASKMYDYSGFGDTPILSIVNPMDVLAVPVGEVGKLRVCRWYFAAVLSDEDGYILDDKDFNVTDLGDIFESKCLENLEEHVKASYAEEVQRHTYDLSGVSSLDIHNICVSLSEAKDALESRVQNI